MILIKLRAIEYYATSVQNRKEGNNQENANKNGLTFLTS